MIRDLDPVLLAVDLPEHGLKYGDLGAVVLIHEGGGYEVEFVTLDGHTLAVVTLLPSQIRPVSAGLIAHARAVVA